MTLLSRAHPALAALLASALMLTPAPGFSASSPPPAFTIANAAGIAGIIQGDSLARGEEDYSGVDLGTALQAQFGTTFINLGIGSQKSTQIAMRQGGVPIQLTFSNNLIYYSYSTITAIQGVALSSMGGMATNQDPDYRFLNTTSSDNTLYLYGTVCGIHGLLSGQGSGGPPSTSVSYNFIPDNPTVSSLLSAAPQACAAQSVFTPDTAVLNVAPTVIVAGRNNNTQISQIESDIAGMTAASPNNLVFSVVNAEYEPSGSSAYTTIVSDNAALAGIYGSHYFDWREYLVSQANLSDPADAYDHANDIPPRSLRAIIVRGTLNGAISSTSTCSFALTPTLGTVATGVLKVDSEYIYVSAVSGNSVTACTRGYGTGGTAATHLTGAAFTISDFLHVSGAADALVAAYIKSTTALTNALFGQTQNGHVTGHGQSAQFSAPIQYNGTVTFNGETFFGSSITLGGSQGIWGYNQAQGFQGALTQIIGFTGGSGTITIGGSQNTFICMQMGGQSNCQAGMTGKGMWYTTEGFSDQGSVYNTTATSGSTVIIPDTGDTLDLNISGGLAALTIQLPSCNSNYPGKVAHITTTTTITALTLTTTSGSVAVNTSPGTLSRATAAKCNVSTNTWLPY